MNEWMTMTTMMVMMMSADGADEDNDGNRKRTHSVFHSCFACVGRCNDWADFSSSCRTYAIDIQRNVGKPSAMGNN